MNELQGSGQYGMATEEELQIVIIEDLATTFHENAKAHGFWEDIDEMAALLPDKFQQRFKTLWLSEKMALETSEISETLEAIRHDPNAPDEHCPEFTKFEIEQADLVIRTLELCRRVNARIGLAMMAKHKYNKSRPYKHGKQN